MGPKGGLKKFNLTLKEIVKNKPNAIMGFKGALNIVTNLDSQIPFIYNMTASTNLNHPANKVIIGDFETLLDSCVDGVAVHVNFSSKYEAEQLRNLAKIANKCDKHGMPLLAIAYPRKESHKGIEYNFENIKGTDEYIDLIAHSVRVAEELGADIVKTFYTGTRDSFREITSAVNIPVIVAGGPKIRMSSVLILIKDIIKSGGAGICFGRNIFNSEDISQIMSEAQKIIFGICDKKIEG